MNKNNTYVKIQNENQKFFQQNQIICFSNNIQTTHFKLYSQISHLQNLIMAQLFINKNLINYFNSQKHQNNNKKVMSEASTNSKTFQAEGNFQVTFQLKNSIQIIKKQKEQTPNKKHRIKKTLKKKDSQSSYSPSEEYENYKIFSSKSSQTKNIPKNFGSSILNFIKKNTQLVKRLLEEENISQSQFFKILQQFSLKLNTIADLRSFWTNQQNPYAKICRILSMIYLRKHSLEHIFNSRIQNYARHIKYRYKIIQGVKNPCNFSQMKDF